MTTATSRKADPDAKIIKRRRELCESRLDIERKLQPDYDRIEVIDAELKQIAGDLGDSFNETIAGKGDVSVSPAYGREFKGDVPVVQTEAWLALKKSERNDLVKRGIIKVQPQWGKAFGGRVSVKALSAAAAVA